MNDNEKHSLILSLHKQLRQDRLSCEKILHDCLQKIATHDKIGACLNSVLELNPNALDSAKRLDAERRMGRLRGPLHGIPFLVKDNINTKDPMNASSGSHYMLGIRTGRDAEIVARLRRAGCLVLGTANMDEFACCGGLPSGRGGQIRNPYSLMHDPCGSSGGSAAAVAAGFCPFSIGTDTQSSVRYPASDCSVVGFKPTTGLPSSLGIFPTLATIDVPGPLATTVKDILIVFRAMISDKCHSFLTKFVRYDSPRHASDVKGLRFGLMTSLLGFDSEIDRVVEAAIQTFAHAGAELIEVEQIPIVPYGGDSISNQKIVAVHDRAVTEQYFDSLPRSSRLSSFADFHSSVMLSKLPCSLPLKNEMLMRWPAGAKKSPSVSLKVYHQARKNFFGSQRAHIDRVFEKHNLAGLIFATKGFSPRSIFHEDFFRPTDYPQSRLASYSGYPEISVPAGYTRSGLPVGLSLLGPAMSDLWLLSIAHWFESFSGTVRRKPILQVRKVTPLPGVPAIPSNSSFAKKRILRGRSGSVTGNTIVATVEHGEPRHGVLATIDRTVWFSWKAPASGLVQLTLSRMPSSLHVIAVYAGGALKSLVEIGCNNRAGAEPGVLRFVAHRASQYHFVIGSSDDEVGSGKFDLTWRLCQHE